MSNEIISQELVNKYLKKKVPWGFSGLGYVTYKRTYAREKENGEMEEWPETIARCINGAQKIGAEYTPEEAKRLFDHVFNLRCNFAGRMLWQLGTDVIERLGANSLLNCWFTSITKPEDFCFIFENLMLGGGVGFSVRRENIHELPKIKHDVVITHESTNDATFIVPDSREGWIELLRRILEAQFTTGKSFTYSTILIRGYGEKINAFGGKASGPQPLIKGMNQICETCKERVGKKLRSVDVLDICNIIGTIVVAGNVRRSAEIALGDPDDYLYLRAKRWDLGTIPNWRALSNNTIYADDFSHISDQVWSGYEGNGEPYGFFNLPLSQKFGRLGEPIKDNCDGTNPCSEISLADYECCNLAELYLNNIDSKEQLIDCGKLIYKTQKVVCSLNFIHDETNKIVHKNMRIGLGITGVCQSNGKLEWLDGAYKAFRKFDVEWSKKRNWPTSIKLTTIKPSGTLSLLAGATPGVHPGFSKFHIRRIRIASNDQLIEICRNAGYKIEFVKNFDGTDDHSTCVVEFPCKFADNTVIASEMSAIKQLELVKQLQTTWADNAISVTVYYKKEELPEIKEWLKENYKKYLKSVSFLLHKDHGFVQAPLEEIDEETYDKIISKIEPINQNTIKQGKDLESLECETGMCPIK